MGTWAAASQRSGELTDNALAEMRALILELRPEALREEGLAVTIRKNHQHSAEPTTRPQPRLALNSPRWPTRAAGRCPPTIPTGAPGSRPQPRQWAAEDARRSPAAQGRGTCRRRESAVNAQVIGQIMP